MHAEGRRAMSQRYADRKYRERLIAENIDTIRFSYAQAATKAGTDDICVFVLDTRDTEARVLAVEVHGENKIEKNEAKGRYAPYTIAGLRSAHADLYAHA